MRDERALDIDDKQLCKTICLKLNVKYGIAACMCCTAVALWYSIRLTVLGLLWCSWTAMPSRHQGKRIPRPHFQEQYATLGWARKQLSDIARTKTLPHVKADRSSEQLNARATFSKFWKICNASQEHTCILRAMS